MYVFYQNRIYDTSRQTGMVFISKLFRRIERILNFNWDNSKIIRNTGIPPWCEVSEQMNIKVVFLICEPLWEQMQFNNSISFLKFSGFPHTIRLFPLLTCENSIEFWKILRNITPIEKYIFTLMGFRFGRSACISSKNVILIVLFIELKLFYLIRRTRIDSFISYGLLKMARYNIKISLKCPYFPLTSLTPFFLLNVVLKCRIVAFNMIHLTCLRLSWLPRLLRICRTQYNLLLLLVVVWWLIVCLFNLVNI